MNFYENYVALCNRDGKSPSAVALEIGLSKPTVNRWKNGGGVTDATAAKVANYFEVPVDALMSEYVWDAFGLNLDCYLEGEDISVENLSKDIGVDPSEIYDWLSHKKYPTKSTIKKIADILALTEDDLCEDRSAHLTFADWFVPPAWMSESDATAIKKFLRLSDEQKKIISDTMDNFLRG